MRTNIPTTFRRNGYDYELLRAETTPSCSHVYAIYAQSRHGSVCAYEAMRLRERPERVIGDTVVPAGPKLPGNEAWGTDGFTLQTEAKAHARLAEMIEQDIQNATKRKAA